MFSKKKKEQELKEKLKKEIIKELKKEKLKQEQVMIAKPVKPPVLHHSKEELVDIRKSFLKIFLFSLAVLFVIIVILILNPFTNKKENNDKELNNDNPIVEEYEKTLINREDGVIENTNEEMLELFNLVVPNLEEYYLYDSTYLYSEDELSVNDLSSEYLLYLMSKSKKFKKIINNSGKLTKLEICNNDEVIRIPVETIDNLVHELFNITSVEYKDFIYTHYIDDIFSTYLQFKYSDGYYVSFCCNIDNSDKFSSIAMPIISEAYKSGEQLIIKVKVAFITKDKVYADYLLKNEISNNINADFLNYINFADTYEYRYKLIDNKYKFESIIKG